MKTTRAGSAGERYGAASPPSARNTILISTARGGIVDEAPLAQALQDDGLAAAAVDVYEHEPLPAGSILAGCPNLLLTPHIAGVTRESNQRVAASMAQRIAELIQPVRGRPSS